MHQYYPQIDGLRAIAIILVVCFHSGLQPFARGGYLGVDIFFVISGYLITHVLLRQYRTQQTIDLKAFFINRFKRLYPLLVTMVIALLAYLALFKRELLGGVSYDAIFSLLYISNIYATQGTETTLMLLHTWSLSLEEQFYICWALGLAFLLHRRYPIKQIGLFCLFTALVIASWRVWVIYQAVNYGDGIKGLYYRPDLRGDGLMLGCALACWVSHKQWLTKPMQSVSMARAGVVAFVLMVLSGVYAPSGDKWMFYIGYLMFYLLVCVVVLDISCNKRSMVARLLAKDFFVYIGIISYSLYIWHLPIIQLIAYDSDSLWKIQLTMLPILFLMSHLSYVCIETRLVGRKNKLEVVFGDRQ